MSINVDLKATTYDPITNITKFVVDKSEVKKEEKKKEKKGDCFCDRDITADELIALGISKINTSKFLGSINTTMTNYNINTCKRKLHFLAQVRHESGEFAYQKEGWGPTKAQLGYEGRKDLGNTEKGDGKKFMGRGLIQITGSTNYTNYGTYKGEDFIVDPNHKKMAELPYCTDSAGWYWSKNLSIDLNDYADKDDLIYITYRINGGFNGYIEDRKPKLLQMIKALKCENTKFENFDEYLLSKSKLWDNYNMVYIYAKLNTTESKDCYKRFLELTEDYLTWNSIKKSLKKKVQLETKRAKANEKII